MKSEEREEFMRGRHHHVFTIIVILSVAINAYGQFGIRKGVKAGYNWATLTGDNLSGVQTRKSFTGGVGLEFSILGLFAFEVDILYSPRGASFQNNADTKLTYISLPFVFKKKFFPVGVHPYILGGPEFSYLLSAKTNGTNIKNEINAQDLAIVLGGGIELSFLGKSAYLEGRYCYGLNRIYKDATQPSLKNRVSQVFLGILF